MERPCQALPATSSLKKETRVPQEDEWKKLVDWRREVLSVSLFPLLLPKFLSVLSRSRWCERRARSVCSRTRESEREKESAPLSREKTKKGRESLSFSAKKVKTLRVSTRRRRSPSSLSLVSTSSTSFL